MSDATEADQLTGELERDEDARRGWVKSQIAECPKCGAKHERYSAWFGFNIKYLGWLHRIRLTCSTCSCPILILPKDARA